MQIKKLENSFGIEITSSEHEGIESSCFPIQIKSPYSLIKKDSFRSNVILLGFPISKLDFLTGYGKHVAKGLCKIPGINTFSFPSPKQVIIKIACPAYCSDWVKISRAISFVIGTTMDFGINQNIRVLKAAPLRIHIESILENKREIIRAYYANKLFNYKTLRNENFYINEEEGYRKLSTENATVINELLQIAGIYEVSITLSGIAVVPQAGIDLQNIEEKILPILIKNLKK
jgi:hypothetical protein